MAMLIGLGRSSSEAEAGCGPGLAHPRFIHRGGNLARFNEMLLAATPAAHSQRVEADLSLGVVGCRILRYLGCIYGCDIGQL